MTNSHSLFLKAQALIPGGVNSPVRAFTGVGGEPVFFKQAQGAYLLDVDGRSYLDYVGSWGPLILGHCHPRVIDAVQKVLHQGMSFGAPTELEILLAEKIIDLMPSIEKIRMVNSGTEATMTAIRLARGFTKKSKIIKFNGCYHGHSDSLLVKAGSGVLTLSLPASQGIPDGVVADTLVAEFNNLTQVTQLCEMYADDLAAIIVEPIAGNMGMVLPDPVFLEHLRSLCDAYGAVLIFDEVMTGFRVALGGAQALYNVVPDLTTLGKIIGGGMPVGAIGGRTEIMDCLAPIGGVYQAGTLSGNPLAMAAGLATLIELEKPGFYQHLDFISTSLVHALTASAADFNLPFQAVCAGGMFGFFFNASPVREYAHAADANEKLFKQFFSGMLAQGIYCAPSRFEAGFVSSAHTIEDIQHTHKIVKLVFSKLSLDS